MLRCAKTLSATMSSAESRSINAAASTNQGRWRVMLERRCPAGVVVFMMCLRAEHRYACSGGMFSAILLFAAGGTAITASQRVCRSVTSQQEYKVSKSSRRRARSQRRHATMRAATTRQPVHLRRCRKATRWCRARINQCWCNVGTQTHNQSYSVCPTFVAAVSAQRVARARVSGRRWVG